MTPSITSSTTHQYQALTGMRCVLATCVFLYHNRKYWRADVPHWLLQLLNELHLGVSLFFVLSGFVIAHRYLPNPPIQGRPYIQYLLMRVIRIFPVYWLIVLLSFADWGIPNNQPWWLTLSLLHGLSNKHNLDGLAQAWSLTVEYSFYTIAPIVLHKWCSSVVRALGLLVLSMVAAIGIGYAWYAINGNPFQFLYPYQFVLHNTFFGRWYEFAAGMYLASILHKPPTWLSKCPFPTTIGGVGLLVTIFVIAQFEPTILDHGYQHPIGFLCQMVLVPLFAIVLFWGLITRTSWLQTFLSSQAMVLLGNASFAFYLIHISYVNIRLRNWHLFPDRNFVLLWLIATLLYLFFEKPLHQWLKQRVNQLN